MRVLGSRRRQFFLLVASVLVFGTVVEEARSGRLMRMVVGKAAQDGSESSGSKAKRLAAKQGVPVVDIRLPAVAASAPVSALAAEPVRAPQATRLALPALEAATEAQGPEEATASTGLAGPAIVNSSERQGPTYGFNRIGVNPFVGVLLGSLHGTVDEAEPEDDTDPSLPKKQLSLASEKVTQGSGIIKASTISGGAGATAAGELGLLPANPAGVTAGLVEDVLSHSGVFSKGQPDSFHAELVAAVTSSGPSLGGGSGELPAVVVGGLVTPDARDDVRDFLWIEYGAVPGAGVSGLALTEDPTAVETIINPEPGSLLLLGSALIGLTHWLRRSRRDARRL